MSNAVTKKTNPIDGMLLEVMESINRREGRLENLLPADMPVSRFKESIRLALAITPALLKCDPASVVLSVLKAAKVGVDVSGGSLGHGYLVPYGQECTFVPGYKGLVSLAILAGVVLDMTPVLVYERDAFEVEEGDVPRVAHKPFIPRKANDSRGAIIAAYTRVLLPSGRHVVKGLLYADDIARIESGTAKGGPWGGKHRPEMVKKSTVKNAFKTLGTPTSEQAERLRRALEADADAEALEVDGRVVDVPEEKPATRTAGLKARLTAGQPRETLEATQEKVPLPISHPDAEPPDEVFNRTPGEEG